MYLEETNVQIFWNLLRVYGDCFDCLHSLILGSGCIQYLLCLFNYTRVDTAAVKFILRK